MGVKADIGVVGLGVMGRNLVLNMADHGFTVAVFNRTGSVTQEFAAELGRMGSEASSRIQPSCSLEEFVESLGRPRRVLIMIKAGKPVDAVIEGLRGLLEPGDVLMDGGNSLFRDTERRAASAAEEGIHYLGIGISGGESGARTGPSLMPGGSREGYESVRAVLEAIAARADGEPCAKHLGRGAAGHYVKMVHNGIEYGFMQLIAESYAFMKLLLGLSNEELSAAYGDWNKEELESYLVEITARIFARRDEKTGGALVDVIRAEAEQLGTGMWTSESAMELHVPVPNIDVAVAMRNLSALKDQRDEAGRLFVEVLGDAASSRPASRHVDHSPAPGVVGTETVRSALYAGMVIAYAQGFAQLQTASTALGYDLRLEDVASIWRGGCIIRSRLLSSIRAAFGRRTSLPNLLLDEELAEAVAARRQDLARVVQVAADAGIPVPGLMAALSYLDSYRARWLPFNLIQAQRDYFGAHEYRRIDAEGVFHTDWLAEYDEAW